MSELCVVGDVHGEIGLLEKLIKKVPSDIKLVFVGDLVNRGPHSKEVLDFVGNLLHSGMAHVVMGNHERALLKFIENGDFVQFAHHGGAATIRSYVGQVRADVHQHFIECFPTEHLELIRGFLPFFETTDLVVVHRSIDPAHPLFRDGDSLTAAAVDVERLLSTAREKYVVFGHFPQRQVTCRGRSIYLDTGCGYGGGLSCLLWPEREALTVTKV